MYRAEFNPSKPFYDSLPHAPKLKILSFLSFHDLMNVRCVNKELYRLAWESILSRSFPEIHKIAIDLLNVCSKPQVEKLKKEWNWRTFCQRHDLIHQNSMAGHYSTTKVDLGNEARFWSGIDCFLEIVDGKIIHLDLCASIRIFDFNGFLLNTIENEVPIWGLKPHSGKLIVAFEDGSIKICSMNEQVEPLVLKEDDEMPLFLNVVRNQITAVYQHRMIRLWDLTNGTLIEKQDMTPFVEADASTEGENDPNEYNYVEQAVFFDDKVLVRFYSDQMLVWDLKNKQPIPLENPLEAHLKELLVIDEKIIGIPWEGSIKIWECRTGKQLHDLSVGANVLSFKLYNGKLFLGLKDGSIEIWNYSDGKREDQWLAHTLGIEHLDIWQEGKIITASKESLKMWDAKGKLLYGTELANLKGLSLDDLSGKVVLAFEDAIQICDFTLKK